MVTRMSENDAINAAIEAVEMVYNEPALYHTRRDIVNILLGFIDRSEPEPSSEWSDGYEEGYENGWDEGYRVGQEEPKPRSNY